MRTFKQETRKWPVDLNGSPGGLMVSALASGLDGPGSSPGRGTALCSWSRHLKELCHEDFAYFWSKLF